MRESVGGGARSIKVCSSNLTIKGQGTMTGIFVSLTGTTGTMTGIFVSLPTKPLIPAS